MKPGFISKHRTLLMYLVAGGLTTLVNYALLFLFLYLLGGGFDLHTMFLAESEDPALFNISNTLAVVGAIIFAYFINKWLVFQTKCENIRVLMREMVSFFASRGLTTLFEIGACAFLISVLSLPELPGKLAVTAVVIALNYILSVTVVFRKKD